MSSSVDNRVVVLSFDNQDFERNVQTSLGTLDKLKKGLDLEGASKGISALSASAKSFDLGPMGDAIEGIKDRFSTLGIIGMTVIQNLTNKAVDFGTRVLGQVVSGGIKRALNFEQAEFQLEGLLGNVEGGKQKIDEIMQAANNAVTGTAYGLDEAAKAASQLVASGIQDGQQMEFILKGIAGTAAMTGSSYTDMADIFTTVAGNGKLMTEQLRQFSHRGLNVAATLADQLGVTEQEIREMVKAGAIDFEVFSTAMADAFGEHAQAANKTFTGSLSNVKAALSRLGAKVAMPALDHLRDIFNVLGPMIDAVSAALDPLINVLKYGMEGAARVGVKAITTLYLALGGDVENLRKKTEYMSNDAKNAMNTAINHYERVAEIFNNLREAFKRFGTAIGGAFKETFEGLFSVDIKGAIEGLKNFSEKLILSDTAMEGLKRIIKIILSPLRLFIQLIEKVAPVIGKVAGFIGNAILSFLEFVGAAEKVSLSAENLERKTRFLESVSKIIHNVGEAFRNLGQRLKDTWDVIKNSSGVRHLVSELKELWSTIKELVGDKVDKFLGFLEKISGKKLDLGQGAFLDFAHAISSIADKIAEFIKIIRTGENPITSFFDSIKTSASSLFEGENLFSGLISGIKNFFENNMDLKGAFGGLKTVFEEGISSNVDLAGKGQGILAGLQKFASFIGGALSQVNWGMVTTQILKIAMAIGALKVLFNLAGVLKSGVKFINSAKGLVDNASQALKKFTKQDKVADFADKLKTIATGVALLAGSLFLISKIPSDQLKTSLLVLAGLLGSMIGTMVLLDKAKLDGKKLEQTALSFAAVSASLLILSIAMKAIAKMTAGEIAKSEIAIAGIIAIFTIASKAMKDVKGGSASFAAMALAIDLLIPAMLVFGNMKPEKLVKGGAAVLALLMSMALASKVAKGAAGGAASMILMALALDALIPAMLVFGNMKTEKLIQAGVAIEAFMFSMVAATNLATSAVAGAASMLLMAVSIDALIPAVLVFGNMDTEKLIQGGVAVVALLTSLALASKIAQGSVKGAAAMLLMTVPLLAIGAALALLANFSWDGILAAGVALSAVMVAIAGAARLAPSSFTGVTTLLAMTVPLLGAAAALAIVARYDWKSILAAGAAISGVIMSMSGAILLLQAVPIPGALIAVADLAIFIGALAGIMVALGALSEYTSFGELVKSGAGVLGQLGRGLGDFVGGIIEGVGEGIANTLPKIGEGLSGFAVSVQPFLDAMSKVDSTVIDGVVNLSKAMLIICGTEFLDALSSGFGLFDSSAVRFGESLAEFAPYLVQFSDEVSGIDENRVQAAANAAMLLASFAANIPNEGGFISLFTGENSLAAFAEELIPFGEAISKYSESVSGSIDEESVAASTRCAQLISEFASTIPNEGGILAELIGDNTLAQFAEGLVPFGEAISQYSDSVKGKIDEESVAASTRSAQLIADFAKTIPNEGGFLADFVGDNTLARFAENLIPFGEAITKYSSTVTGGVNEDAVAASMRAAQMVSDFANTIPNEGGLVAKITGDNDLATFGEGLKAFGPSLAKYSTDIAGVDADKVTASANAAKMIADFASTVPSSGGLVQLVTGDNDLAQFGTQLQAFGPTLASYSESVSGINEEAVTTSVNAATIIAEFYDKMLPTQGGLAGFFEGNPLIHFGEELQGFGPLIASYSESVKGAIDQPSIEASSGAAEMLATMYKKITESGISGGIEGFLKGNPLKKFGQELASFGPLLVEYANSIRSISINKIADVNNIMPAIVDMALVANSAYYDHIVDFGESLKVFGQKLLQYYISVRSIEHDKVAAAIKTVYDLIAMGKTMEIVDTETMTNFGEALADVALNGIDDFISAFSGEALADAKVAVCDFVSNAASGVSAYTAAWYGIGVEMANGMINGLNNSSWAIYQTAANIAYWAAQTIRNALQIASPSKVMYEIGEYIVEGMALGMKDCTGDIKARSEDVANTIIDSVAKPINELQNAMEEGIDVNPVITPVMDLSSISSGTDALGTMLGDANVPISLAGNLGGSMIDSILNLANKISENQGTQESVVNAISGLRSDVNALGDRMSRMQLMLDGKTLVGGIIEDVDTALGDRLALAQRGV